MTVSRRARFLTAVRTWAARTAGAFGVAAVIGVYTLFGGILDIDIAGVYWTAYLGALVVALAGFVLVMVGDGARSLVLRTRARETQRAEVAAGFRQGAPTVELRKGDYALTREEIERLARSAGYRLAAVSRPGWLVLRFRSDVVAVAEEEQELAEVFAAARGPVRLDPSEYRLNREWIRATARRHGFALTEDDTPRESGTLTFRRRLQQGEKKRPWYRQPSCLVLLVLFWPIPVVVAAFWVVFRSLAFYLVGVFGFAGLGLLFPGEPARTVIFPTLVYGYLPLVTLFSLWRIYRDWRSQRRPEQEQRDEVERLFATGTARVRVKEPRYSLSRSEIERIGGRHGYRLVPRGPRDPSTTLRFDREAAVPGAVGPTGGSGVGTA